MAVVQVNVRSHSRGRGQTVAAALAYRTGERLRCSLTGRRHDYRGRRRREEVASWGTVGTQHGRLEELAAAMEGAEKRKNSMVARDVVVALPHELGEGEREVLARAYAGELAKRYGAAVCWAVHRPGGEGDARNHHAHLLMSTRRVAEDGRGFGAKLRELDCKPKSAEEVWWMRERWTELANAALAREGVEARLRPEKGAGEVRGRNVGRGAVQAERRAWRERNPGRTLRGMSVTALVADGGARTRRGRRKAKTDESARLERAIAETELALSQTKVRIAREQWAWERREVAWAELGLALQEAELALLRGEHEKVLVAEARAEELRLQEHENALFAEARVLEEEREVARQTPGTGLWRTLYRHVERRWLTAKESERMKAVASAKARLGEAALPPAGKTDGAPEAKAPVAAPKAKAGKKPGKGHGGKGMG